MLWVKDLRFLPENATLSFIPKVKMYQSYLCFKNDINPSTEEHVLFCNCNSVTQVGNEFRMVQVVMTVNFSPIVVKWLSLDASWLQSHNGNAWRWDSDRVNPIISQWPNRGFTQTDQRCVSTVLLQTGNTPVTTVAQNEGCQKSSTCYMWAEKLSTW